MVLDSSFANWPEARERMAAWYATPLGRELDAAIQDRARRLLLDVHGQHALQIGGSARDTDFLAHANMGHRIHLIGEAGDAFHGEPEMLPLTSGSINLLVLCHILEFREDPLTLLTEAERVLAPEGRMLIVSFNAWSLFGLRRALPHDGVPWSGRFQGHWRTRYWCRRTGLEIENRAGCWRRPPAHGYRLRRWLGWLEHGHASLDRCGAVQLLLVRKRRIPLNPIPLRMRRRQRLSASHPARPTMMHPGDCRRLPSRRHVISSHEEAP